MVMVSIEFVCLFDSFLFVDSDVDQYFFKWVETA